MKSKLKRTARTQYAKELRLHVLLNVLIRFLVRVGLTKLFGVRTYTPILKDKRTPYILIANHSSSFDPFIYTTQCHYRLHFIASDAQFRNIAIRILFNIGGTIAKKKGQHDLSTVDKMLYVLKVLKDPICIFAEGKNTWDGAATMPLDGTASFIKYAKLPVFVAYTHGAYLSYPRWGHSLRRGKITVFVRQVLNNAQIAGMKRDAIHKIIGEALQYNEFNQQAQFPQSFVSAKRAEYVERVLFACPHCKQTQKIASHKQYFLCRGCRHSWFMDLQGFFHPVSSILRTSSASANNSINSTHVDATMYNWNTWQQSFLKMLINTIQTNEVLFYDEQCVLRYGTSRTSLQNGVGRLSLSPSHLYFMPYLNKNRRNYPCRTLDITNLQAVNVQNKELLEWTQNKMFYQIKSQNPRFNAYKYLSAIEYIQHTQKKK